MEVLTLTIACHEGRPPADDIFAHSGCPQPVPSDLLVRVPDPRKDEAAGISMPTLYRQLKKLPWASVPAFSAVTTDHGRGARRTVKAC
jgi:hypothetical protein